MVKQRFLKLVLVKQRFLKLVISNCGRCYNIKTKRFVGAVNSRGYVYAALHNDDGQKSIQMHRLVMSHFGPPQPTNTHEIDHINHDRTDNRISNLRYVTKSENNKNKAAHKHVKYTYHNQLPETAEELSAYNNHEFKGLFVDFESQKLFVYNGQQFRELVAITQGPRVYYTAQDITGKQRGLYHNVLFG